MNKIVYEVLNSSKTDEEKNRYLNDILFDIEIAKGVLTGKYKYCEDCDDYYLAKSFLEERETKEQKICTYRDPINSGGNDYADGFVDITYCVCPKGHRREVNRNERLK